MRKQWILAALVPVVMGSTLAFAKTASNTAPLSAIEANFKKCELHGTRLQNDVVPITYGRAGSPVPYATEKRAFPHARSRVFGGCIVSEDSPQLQAVKFCPKCRAAGKRWLAAHHLSIPKK